MELGKGESGGLTGEELHDTFVDLGRLGTHAADLCSTESTSRVTL